MHDQANAMLRILYLDEPENVLLQGVYSDFDGMQQKVFSTFQTTNVNGELIFLRKIKTFFIQRQQANSSEPIVYIPELLAQINNLVKTESKKGSTMNTITKLIKNSSKETSCFLCKQGLNAPLIEKMNQNFPVEAKSSNIEAGIRAQRDQLQTSLESLV